MRRTGNHVAMPLSFLETVTGNRIRGLQQFGGRTWRTVAEHFHVRHNCLQAEVKKIECI